MISKKHKFIFIHIPRTGGTSIENMLSNYQEGELIDIGGGIWMPDEEIKNLILNTYSDFNFYNDAKHMKAIDWKKILGDEYENYYKFTIVRNPYDKFLSMKKFENGADISTMESWRYKQDIFIEDSSGVIVDDVFYYEDYENSLDQIFKKLNIETPNILHKNNKKNVNMTLTDNEKKWISKNLLSDFQKLGYDI